MTKTEMKLNDTRIQLEMALSRENVEKPDLVKSCIHAFITNARSVTVTMQNESNASAELAKWVEARQEQMRKIPLERFFYEQRVISIQQRSVKSNRRFEKIEKMEPDGRGLGPGGAILVYEFEGFDKLFPGDSGNVFSLCIDYYDYLQKMVNAWLEVMG